MSTSEVINLILSLLTLGISTIAIWISISSTRKQNKIALFDKRYQVYYYFAKSFALAKNLKENTYLAEKLELETATILAALDYDENVAMQLLISRKAESLHYIKNNILDFMGKVEQAQFLFPEDIWNAIDLLNAAFYQHALCVVSMYFTGTAVADITVTRNELISRGEAFVESSENVKLKKLLSLDN